MRNAEMKLELNIDSLGIEGYNGDYDYLIEKVETKVYMEVHPHNKLVFFPEDLEELEGIGADIETIVTETTLAIQSLIDEENEEEEQSALDRVGELHMYYSQNTI